VKGRLGPRGIVQQWIPGGDPEVMAAFARAFRDTFPHVRAFFSVEGWGLHMLGSAAPIVSASPGVLAARLPPEASRDIVEWGPAATAADQFALVLKREIPLDAVVARAPRVPALRDDRPINEYYLLRQLGKTDEPARP
jgi:hypothetical protein